MILTDFSNAGRYFALHDRMRAAFDYLGSEQARLAAPGEYNVIGREVYAMVQEYHTMPDDHPGWEGHRRYIDIHLIQSGCEKHLWTVDQALQDSLPYDKENDLIRPQPSRWTEHVVQAGQFVVYFPEDLHKAKCMLSAPAYVRKILMKVAL